MQTPTVVCREVFGIQVHPITLKICPEVLYCREWYHGSPCNLELFFALDLNVDWYINVYRLLGKWWNLLFGSREQGAGSWELEMPECPCPQFPAPCSLLPAPHSQFPAPSS
jgi:hypothetical protein